MKQKDKIQALIKKSEGQPAGESIFDIDTAIEVCRQQEETLDQAEALAEKSGNFKLMVQIEIENNHNNTKALEIIDTKIKNLKEKVQCLQQYVPKLLKTKIDNANKVKIVLTEKKIWENKIMEIVKEIAWALVDYTRNNKKFAIHEEKGFELKSHQKVRIEDLL